MSFLPEQVTSPRSAGSLDEVIATNSAFFPYPCMAYDVVTFGGLLSELGESRSDAGFVWLIAKNHFPVCPE